MGKGDKKTRRGKIFMGSYGVTRPRKASGSPFIPKTAKVPSMVAEQQPVKPVAQPKAEQPKPKVAVAEKLQMVETPVVETVHTPPPAPTPIPVVEAKVTEAPEPVIDLASVPQEAEEKKAPAKPASRSTGTSGEKEAKPAKEKKAPAKTVAKKAAPKEKVAAKKTAAKTKTAAKKK